MKLLRALHAIFVGPPLTYRHFLTPVPARECRKGTAPARERRSVGGLELGKLTDAEKAAGYIGVLTGKIPLDTDSTVLRDRRINSGRPFVERIARDAFAESIDQADDILGMAGHTDDTLAAFARSGSNLVITRSAKEIEYRALLPDTQTGHDLLELAEKKIIRGTSFEFDLGAEDKWEKRGDIDVRTVTKGKLATVNPVPWPAYEGSELTAERGASGTDTEERGNYAFTDRWNDPTMTADTRYAANALNRTIYELTDSLEYLRAAPAGAVAEFARKQVAAATAAATELLAWLAANGSAASAELTARAGAKLTEARSATAPDSTPTNISDDPRETGLRIFTR